MKIIQALLISFLLGWSLQAQTSIMSYNIRYDNSNDLENWWEHRKEEVVELLTYYQPDFIGIQEAMPNQVAYIQELLKNYDHIGHGRDGKGTDSEAIPLFYNTTQFELIDRQVFWLSKTPAVVSKGWDAGLNRITVYGVFRHLVSNDTFYVLNCHFDHVGKVARERSAQLLLDFIKQKHLQDKSLLLMGDLNCAPTDKPVSILKEELEDAYDYTQTAVYGPTGTFNGFDTNSVLANRIDYIFTKNVKVLQYRNVDDRRKNNLYPSDHLPVLISIQY